jgi:hypothetical protein
MSVSGRRAVRYRCTTALVLSVLTTAVCVAALMAAQQGDHRS